MLLFLLCLLWKYYLEKNKEEKSLLIQIIKKIVRIGRLKNNETDFSFADEDVSRKQCILTFEDNNWYISDGDGENESSNGTWFYPEKYFTIKDGMIIRMGTTSFECKFIQ